MTINTVKPVFADNIAGSSAGFNYLKTSSLLNKDNNLKYYKTKKSIKKVLEKYHSPLLGSVDTFISACQLYQLDCYLLPAITGVESSFAKYVSPGSFNPFGWDGGYFMFKNWDEAIFTVASGLRKNYLDKGAAGDD